ncbi:hypothetical protein LCI18_006659 [Fusarium solani-melongenae]|uniref:Uncharacterized protein n=1 Tax=Fusarium solani subsp. cucurbitae TaxID=2747967 RepID=A0ACD3Z390_FUSSC|nr:hypothetical protein LCI18_006659 [Fusarium solani-melongenae]
MSSPPETAAEPVVTTQAPAPAPVSDHVPTSVPSIPVSDAHQQPDSRRRVRRACEYCRMKRLKCTADKRPCLNCQLYGAECVSLPAPSGVRKRRTRAAIMADRARCAVNNDTPPVGEPSEPHPDPPQPSGDADEDDESTGLASGANAFQGVPELVTSPGTTSLSAFEQVISEAGIDFTHDFWGIESFIANCNAPDENAAAEQLLALQSPPMPESAAVPNPLPLSGSKGSVGRIFGVEGLVSQPRAISGAISPGIFHRKDKGNSLFLGFTSTAAIMAHCVRESSESPHRVADSESLRFIVDCGPMCDEIACTNVDDGHSQQIPSTTLATQCVNAFFDDYHASYPVADRGSLGLILDRFVARGHQSLGPLDRSILYLVTALGACSRSSTETGKWVDFENLYALAWQLFPFAVAAPSLGSVQILLLHALYNIHWSKWSIAWVFSGLAARVAQSMGLHLVSPPDFGLDYGQQKLRARLWAVTLVLDAQLSMSQGRPPACQTSQCDAETLLNKGGLLHLYELHWPLSEVLTWRVDLAWIQQKLNGAFSSVFTAEQRLSCIQEADRDLMRWKEGLPLELRPEQQTVLERDAHVDIYMLHLDYFNLLQTIHWGLMNHKSSANAWDHAAPRLRASESICLGASLALVRTLNAMTDGDTRARSFRSRSDHFMSAMAIVYRDLSRNPGKLSARTNLEYLRVIRLHLGRMANKHLLAASLTELFDNMVSSAEELVREHGNIPT